MKKIYLCLMLVQFGIAGMGKQVKDTVVVGESLNSFRIDRESPYVVLPMRVDSKRLESCQSIYLKFEEIVLEKAPEGIYEVYMVDSLAAIGALESTSRFFVHAINTYYLSDRPGDSQLMNGAQQLVWIHESARHIRSFCLVIVFRGNTLADRSFSREAGVLRVGAVKMVSE